MSKNKKSTNISPGWTIANVFIQAIIGGGIIAAFVLTLINIKQQQEFHIDALRAWVSIEPETTIKVEENGIRCKIDYKNFGQSPAFKAQSSSRFCHKDLLNQADVLCSDTIEGEIYATFFPDESYPTMPLSEIIGYSGNYTKSEIKNLIKNKEIYLFATVSYEDFSDAKQYFSIFLLASLEPVKRTPQPPPEEPDKIRVKWAFIQDSQERCIEVPELK